VLRNDNVWGRRRHSGRRRTVVAEGRNEDDDIDLGEIVAKS
jgi:hypothetical protein